MKYLEVVGCFEDAGYAVERVETDQGCIACIAAAARVIAVASHIEADNFLFNPPGITDRQALSASLYCDDGAPGGDRLWIAPENPYFCKIGLADYVDHANHFVPDSIDPGAYAMRRINNSVQFSGNVSVLNLRSQNQSNMQVARKVTQVAMPFSTADVLSVGYTLEQSLAVQSGLAGLWNIAQVPLGSIIVVPLKQSVPATDYFNPAQYSLSENACVYPIKGDSHSKIGYSCGLLAGNSAAFYWVGRSLKMVFRQFPVIEDGVYCDTASENAAKDQVFQAWDGMGFGELEYHSTACGEGSGQAKVSDYSSLYCIEGERVSVLKIASDLLHLSLTELKLIIK